MKNNQTLTRITFSLCVVASILVGACAFKGEKSNLTVDITSFIGDGQAFEENDNLSFLLSLSEDAWVYLYYENAEGNVYQLVPSVLFQNNFIHAGDFIEFPSADAKFEIKISPPFGKERVWLVASTKQLSKAQEFNTELNEIALDLEKIKRMLRTNAKHEKATFAEDNMDFVSQQAASTYSSQFPYSPDSGYSSYSVNSI